jgi:hypothetical protein
MFISGPRAFQDVIGIFDLNTVPRVKTNDVVSLGFVRAKHDDS